MQAINDPLTLMQALPTGVTAVFNEFYTAELTTLGRGGRPVTWPIMPMVWVRRGLFICATSIGLPQKAFNIRRDPRVSLLFSEPTGSGLARPPAVLVQGVGSVDERVHAARADTDPEMIEVMIAQGRKMMEKQPAMKMYMSSFLTRYLMDWYFMRLFITITPQRIVWWENGDFSRPPHIQEIPHVVEDRPLSA